MAAYEQLKALIRQYIKTNGEQEITGQILQNVLIEMVNQYPDISGYLPKSGGTMTGDLSFELGKKIILAISEGIRRGTDFHLGLNTMGGESYIWNYFSWPNEAVIAGLLGTGVFIGQGFKKDGGTSSQFLKADGSVDNNTYVTRSPSYLDFEQASSQQEDGTIYNDTVIRYQEIYTLDMILPAGRWTYAFNLTGDENWMGDGTTQVAVRNRDTGNQLDKISEGYDSNDAYNNASRYWVSFYLPQMTKVRIELDDPSGAKLYMYRPSLNMGYNRMRIW